MNRYRYPKRRIRWEDEDWEPSEKRTAPPQEMPLPKRKRLILPIPSYNIKHINDLIKLGFLYDSRQFSSPLFRKLFHLIPSLMRLNNMVGMEKIKKQLIDQIIYFIQDYHENDINGNFINTVLLGSPGTGKTEVSHILAGIYKSLGFLPSDKVIIAKKGDFIAPYLGQTVHKTQKLLEKAKGGVLVIDEVYSFGSESKSNGDSYGKEAIDTLNQYLSENRRELVCIVIGYEKDVENCFFAQNQGLKRRFPFTYKIDDYTSLELKDIFMYQVNKNNWTLVESEKTQIQAYLTNFFREQKKYFKTNGGSTESVFFKCKLKQSLKTFGKNPSSSEKFQLSLNVIQETLEDYIKECDAMPITDQPPDNMYN